MRCDRSLVETVSLHVPLILLLALLGAEQSAFAQSSAGAQSWIVSADTGYLSTWDDEGLLGRGVSVGAGVGIRLTPRITLQALVSRNPYRRDIEYLSVDGRTLFAGVEAALQSRRRTVRPYGTLGYGVLTNDGVWVQKFQTAPFGPRVEQPFALNGTFGALTASGGIDVRTTEHLSIRAGVRFYGVRIKRDSDPSLIIGPSFGVTYGR